MSIWNSSEKCHWQKSLCRTTHPIIKLLSNRYPLSWLSPLGLFSKVKGILCVLNVGSSDCERAGDEVWAPEQIGGPKGGPRAFARPRRLELVAPSTHFAQSIKILDCCAIWHLFCTVWLCKNDLDYVVFEFDFIELCNGEIGF